MSIIEIYHYGDCGGFDDDNPFKLFEDNKVKEILYYIGKSDVFSIGLNDLVNLIDIDTDALLELINKMKDLDLITEKNYRFSVNFTIIFEKDLEEIDKFSKAMAHEISDAIIKSKKEIDELANKFKSSCTYNVDELLYHIIGSYILDGLAIETLSEQGLFKISKVRKNKRDYILFGFEKSEKVDQFSENILCSCNNYRTETLSFVSFGDAAGDRNDFYRFNRKVSSKIHEINTREETKSSYLNILEEHNLLIAKRCSRIINELLDQGNTFRSLNEEDIKYAKYLKAFNYIEEESGYYRVSVPVFYLEDHDIIKALHSLLINIILPIIKGSFETAEKELNISPLIHGVDIKEVLNEMWHQIFGNINEDLVKLGMIKKPDYFEGEGRYLKAIYRHK